MIDKFTALNLWFYKPSPGMAADRAPDQALPLKAASPKVWAGLFATTGDYSMATSEVAKAVSRPSSRGSSAASAPAPAQETAGSAPRAAAAGGAINIGDVLVPKIANIKVVASPAADAKTVVTLTKTDELVVIGTEKNGFVQVQGASGEGWVKPALFTKQ